MKTKVFMLLLVGVLVLGGGIGGAFASGMAIGKSQGKEAAQKTLPTLSPSGSGQSTQEQLQQLRQQFQGQAGQTGQGGGIQRLQGQGGLTGTVEKIEGNTLTVNTAQGPLQATIGADTTIQMSVQGTTQDLTAGVRVTVVGQRGDDGNVAATSIIITPAGVDGLLGGGSNPGGSQ